MTVERKFCLAYRRNARCYDAAGRAGLKDPYHSLRLRNLPRLLDSYEACGARRAKEVVYR